MKQLIILVSIVILLALTTTSIYARQGCCSHHGGVSSDGCGCNDGTPLSDTCAPYYVCTTNTNNQAPVVQGTEVPTSVPTTVPTEVAPQLHHRHPRRK